MFPYWILFSIFALGSIEYRRRHAYLRQSHPLLIAACVFIALMIGLRYQVGGDWVTYINMFDEIRYVDAARIIRMSDPGYTFFNRVAHWLGVQIWFVNLLCGIVFTWGLLAFARRQPNPWLAVLIAVPYLIIVVAMGYTRQAVAIGFVLAGLAALDRGSTPRFVFYVLCAVAFHKSAIILLPIVALSTSRNRILSVALLIVIGLLVYYLFVAGSIEGLVTNYAEYESQGAGIRAAMNVPPALLYLRFQDRFGLPPWQQKLWRNFALAALLTVVALMVLNASAAVDRLALYLIPMQVFVLSRLPVIFGGKTGWNSQLALAIIAYSAAIQFVWLNYANNASYWIPYQLWPIDGSA